MAIADHAIERSADERDIWLLLRSSAVDHSAVTVPQLVLMR